MDRPKHPGPGSRGASRSTRPVAAALSALAALATARGVGAQAAPAAAPDGTLDVARPDLHPLENFDAAWSLIDRTHFDPDFNGVDWATVGEELRPRAAASESLEELRGVIQEMIGRLGQSHFALIPREIVDSEPSEIDDSAAHDADAAGDASTDHESPPPADDDVDDGTPGDVGLDLRLIEGQMVVTDVADGGPAAAAGIRRGWNLTAVNDLEVAPALESLGSTLEPRMASFQSRHLITSWLEGPAGRSVRLTLVDGSDESREITLRRRPRPGEVVQFGNLPPMSVHLESSVVEPSGAGPVVGIIRFTMWLGPTVRWVDEAIGTMRHADGIILDIRGNPGGVGAMVMGVSGHFIDERVPLGVMKTRGTELKFLVNPRRVDTNLEPVRPFDGPLAILVDAQSASTSEIFAGGMQAVGRARIFGERTVGAALPAAMDRLPNGDVLLHAFADFLTVDGESLEARGVIPDEVVPRTRSDLLAGRDAALEAAIDWIGREAAGDD